MVLLRLVPRARPRELPRPSDDMVASVGDLRYGRHMLCVASRSRFGGSSTSKHCWMNRNKHHSLSMRNALRLRSGRVAVGSSHETRRRLHPHQSWHHLEFNAFAVVSRDLDFELHMSCHSIRLPQYTLRDFLNLHHNNPHKVHRHKTPMVSTRCHTPPVISVIAHISSMDHLPEQDTVSMYFVQILHKREDVDTWIGRCPKR